MKEIISVMLIMKDDELIAEYPSTYRKPGYIIRSLKKRLRKNPDDPLLQEIKKGNRIVLTDYKEQEDSYSIEEFIEKITDLSVKPRDSRPKIDRDHLKKVLIDNVPVRLIQYNGEVYAHGIDVCKLYGYSGNVENMLHQHLSNLLKVRVRTNEPEFEDYYVARIISAAQIDDLSTHYKFLTDGKKREILREALLLEMEKFADDFWQ